MSVSNSLSNGQTMTMAVVANQTTQYATTENRGTEVLYYNETGTPTSSPNLSFDGKTVDVNGDVYVSDVVIGDAYEDVNGPTTDHGFVFLTAYESVVPTIEVHNNPNTLGNEPRDYDFRFLFGGAVKDEGDVSPLFLSGEETTFHMPLRISPPGAPITPAFYLDHGTYALEGVSAGLCYKYQWTPPSGPTQNAVFCRYRINLNTVFPSEPQIFVTIQDTTTYSPVDVDDQWNMAVYVDPSSSPGQPYDHFWFSLYAINSNPISLFPGPNNVVNWTAIGGI